jgi:tetratricopeptide (TPR) repeat protein
MSIVERTGDRARVPQAQALLAQRELWHGQADAALARLEPLPVQFHLGGHSDHGRSELMLLAEAYMATGNAARAAEVVTSGVERAVAHKNRVALADWRRLQGMLLVEHGRWVEAERAMADAASLAAALPYPYARARALYEWGRLCIQRGAHAEAHGHLEAALAIFQQLGAQPFVERTEKALAYL